MSCRAIDRRDFLSQAAARVTALSAGLAAVCDERQLLASLNATPEERSALERVTGPRLPYKGPNVILIRFGGGVRRLETILSPQKSHCPFVYHELIKKHGILFNNVDIQSSPGIETSHGQGTLYLLTGKYDHYEDITHKPLADRFEAKIPTIFEYLRKEYDI